MRQTLMTLMPNMVELVIADDANTENEMQSLSQGRIIRDIERSGDNLES